VAYGLYGLTEGLIKKLSTDSAREYTGERIERVELDE